LPSRAFLIAVPLLLLAPGPGAAQAPASDPQDEGWNGPRVLELVRRAQAARRELVEDGELESYRAVTEGHIYFFVDPEEGERALIRVDQVAVELRWRAPDQVHQHIMGERSETRLPVREFRYYLDRLTLVQYGFGDEIEVGSGMDVAGVPHPLAPAPMDDPARGPYEYRLADSLALSLPGRPEPVRLYEVEVRPMDPSAPGIVGSLVLDRAGANIVRMAFTFTPASYVDRRTDRISVALDYGLWDDRYWLPNRQEIEVRRELPELDLGIGTVIRAVLRVGEYELNVPMETISVPGRARITQAPPSTRQAYPFTEGLYDGLERHGMADLVLEVDPRELRSRAIQLMRDRPASGLSPFRLHLPRVSDFVRYSRAEGLFLGGGGAWRPSGGLRVRGHAGYAFGERRPRGSVRAEGLLGDEGAWWVEGAVNGVEDLGLEAGSDPLISTVWALAGGEDFRDPYRVSSIRVGVDLSLGRDWLAGVEFGGERHRSMALVRNASPLNDSQAYREVRPIAPGDFLRVEGSLARSGLWWPGDGRGRLSLAADLLAGSPGTGVGLEVRSTTRWGPASATRETRLDLHGRSWLGDPLPQGHRLIGGRGTLPGYPFRSYGGTETFVGSLVHARDLVGPRLRVRGGVHGGWTGGGDSELEAAWSAGGTGAIRASASLGVGLFWDLLRVDGARGLGRGGEWQLLISLDPRWWGVL
jgi:hypothetical protein